MFDHPLGKWDFFLADLLVVVVVSCRLVTQDVTFYRDLFLMAEKRNSKLPAEGK